MIAAAAWRMPLRARLISWRAAPPVTPSSRAISSWPRPSSSRRTIASRWPGGSAATAASTSRKRSRRSSVACAGSSVPGCASSGS